MKSGKLPAFGLFTLVMAGLVSLFQRVGVLFGSSCLLALVLVVVFVSSDGSPLLHAQEAENRFWTVVAMLLSTAVFFAEDSPFAFIGARSPGLGVFMVLSCTAFISWYDRWLRRRRLSRSLHFSKATSVAGRIDESIDALARVDDALARLDHYYIPSTLTRVYKRRETLRLERVIIETLQDATAEELNAVVVRVKLGLVVYKLKDVTFGREGLLHSRHRSSSSSSSSSKKNPQSLLRRRLSTTHEGARTDLVELLAVQRVADLNVASRVALLAALQQMPLAAHPKAEKWVKNIIVWTKADDLTDLKTLADAKGDIHSFHRLVYVDVKNPKIRDEILKHIAREAKIHAAHRLLATRAARSFAARRGDRKVLSDIDDTLVCSGGHYPAGVDRRYPRKTVYPGVCALYKELDLGTAGPASSWEDAVSFASSQTTTTTNTAERPHGGPPHHSMGRLGNLAFLSARPHVYGDLSERASYAKFASLVDRGRLHSMPTMLVGDLKSGSEMMMLGDMEPLALKKARNFAEYASLYPEFRFVFVGDNGQGDARAAELMAEALDTLGVGRHRLERAYIHIVQPIERTHHRHASLDEAKRAWADAGVVFVDTFVDAAVDAALTVNPPLIRPQGLRRILVSALYDIQHHVKWEDEAQRASRLSELSAAFRRANRVLRDAFDLPPVPFNLGGDHPDDPHASTTAATSSSTGSTSGGPGGASGAGAGSSSSVSSSAAPAGLPPPSPRSGLVPSGGAGSGAAGGTSQHRGRRAASLSPSSSQSGGVPPSPSSSSDAVAPGSLGAASGNAMIPRPAGTPRGASPSPSSGTSGPASSKRDKKTIRFRVPPPGTAVKTPFGGGILLRARRDHICEVALDWRLSSRQPAIGFFHVDSIR